MSKKTLKLKADTVLKEYWRDNDRFADLFNAALFQGEQVIRPEELEERDTESSFITEDNSRNKSFDSTRDTIKIRKKSSAYGIEFVILGEESQTYIHYAMPMRIMGYDYVKYKRQYDANAAKYRPKNQDIGTEDQEIWPEVLDIQPASLNGLDRNEFLSKMRKTDTFIPVITIVVYYGEAPWDGARSLHEMLRIPSGFEAYINDYKILLIEARNAKLTLHNPDNIDFFNLLEILLNKDLPRRESQNRAIQYGKEHQTDKAVLKAIAGATNTNLDYSAFEKGDDGMSTCTLFEEIAREGRLEGKAEEIVETGFEFGMPKEDILKRLQTKLDISIQRAMEYLNRYEKSVM